MLVAKDKIKNNVGEYIIYMYQIEDLIRACEFNKNKIEESLVKQYNTEESVRNEIRNWYLGLAELMEEEHIQSQGHLSFVTNKINEINEFHIYLLNNPEHNDYQEMVKPTIAIIDALRVKNDTTENDIQLIIDAIYGYYLLKLKKQTISEGTQQSIIALSSLLAFLSKKFKDYERGEIIIE